jgi:hypothetical protein
MKEPSLAGTKLDRYFHVCALFNSRDEEYSVMLPFYKEAVDWGEKIAHIVMPQHRDDHVGRMRAHGIDTDGCLGCGQLEVHDADTVYLPGGAFDEESMLRTVDNAIASSKTSGFSRLRLMGNMGWAFGCSTSGDQLISYEARVNEVLSRNRQPAVCVYDIAWLSGAMMMDILRCHPLTLIGGVVQENPYFVPPEELLPQLRARERARAAAVN